MRRLRAVFAAFGLLLLAAAAVLLSYGHRYLAAEQRRLLAEAELERERACAAIEAEPRAALERLRVAEAQRPWYHYRHRFVPPDLVANTVAFDVSPLYPAPREPLVTAYFEWEPRSGRLNSPAGGGAGEPSAGPLAQQLLARTHQQRVQALAPLLVPAFGAMFAERERLFTALAAEEVTSQFLVECYREPARTVAQVVAAQRGEPGLTRKLAEQWSAHAEVQERARQAYEVELRKHLPADGYAQAAQQAGGDAGVPSTATDRRHGAGPQHSGGPGPWPPAQTVLDPAWELARNVKQAEPAAAAIRVSELRWVWVGDGAQGLLARASAPDPGAAPPGELPRPPSGALIAVRLVDLDGTPLLQGFAVDLERLLALAVARRAQLGLDGQVQLRQASDPAQAFAASFTAPAAAAVTAALRPSRWLLYGSGGVLAVLATAGLAVLYQGVRGHLELARRRTDFVAAVSHELKAPLTAVRALAELLAGGMVPEAARRQEYYGLIQAESERLSRLVGNVLDFSRLERGRRRYELQPEDVGGLVRAVADAFAPHLAARGFAFEVEVERGLPPVRLDRDAMAQVLANLLDNAEKYTGSCAERRVAVRVRAARGELPPPAVVIEVQDTGIGIAAADRRRLFQPFERGSHPLARGTGGAGLGLAIAHQHVRAHGGRLEVESIPQRGSTFRIVLPAGGAG
ncbi:MAG: hypothetical protein KatS3mg102_2283 [Planctomycetota bacterium]|nr:MAG: hypothetical protein KatS3mg102_2283 [Planctomycetota bacterium]